MQAFFNILFVSCLGRLYGVIGFLHFHSALDTSPDAERSYRVPLYPVIPILAIASGLYVIFSQVFLSGQTAAIMSLFSVVVTLAGLPVYYLAKRKRA